MKCQTHTRYWVYTFFLIKIAFFFWYLSGNIHSTWQTCAYMAAQVKLWVLKQCQITMYLVAPKAELHTILSTEGDCHYKFDFIQ